MTRLTASRFAPLLLLGALLLLLPLLFPSGFYYRIAALVWISGLAALGLNILMGQAGQVSLGHAGFFGIGAYAVAIGPAHLGLHPLLAMLLGALLAGLIAWLVGRPILRLKGYYLAIATLGFGVLVALVITSESRLTGGPDGMAVERIELLGWRIRGAETWYWITGAVLLIGVWLALNLEDSPAGRALRALHDSEVAAAVVGVDLAAFKLEAFVLAAVYASIAGSLLASMNAFVTPDVASFLTSVEFVTMVVVGGMGSVLGSVLGAALLVTLPQLLTVFQEYEHALLGLAIMLVMIFLRQGIVPSLARALGRAG
ncbi:MAG TPA: branched-chain amino acid ABC transporter permease [Geminicoccaceae bacterium]|nr:branched-chain amino acid ABC transporter permease [Geminicoccaceae bacterium]